MDNTTSRTDRVIASYIRELMGSKGVTQAKIGEALAGRSKGYVSDRILGKRSWAISELDRIAAHPEDYDVAANIDENRDVESETPDD